MSHEYLESHVKGICADCGEAKVFHRHSPQTEMTSLLEIKARLAAIAANFPQNFHEWLTAIDYRLKLVEQSQQRIEQRLEVLALAQRPAKPPSKRRVG